MRLRRAHLPLALIVVLHFAWYARKELEAWFYLHHGDSTQLKGSEWYWVPLVALIYLWLWIDSKERTVKLPLAARILVPPLFPVGVPYYYFRAYSPKPALLHVGLFVLFMALCLAAGYLGYRMTFNYYAYWTNHR